MAYTVTVTATYRPGCPACLSDAENIATNGLRDKQVTAIALRASTKCEHDVEAESKAILEAKGQSKLPLSPEADLLPPSDTNGFDPSMRYA